LVTLYLSKPESTYIIHYLVTINQINKPAATDFAFSSPYNNSPSFTPKANAVPGPFDVTTFPCTTTLSSTGDDILDLNPSAGKHVAPLPTNPCVASTTLGDAQIAA
jgi:hypothetical protein